MGVARHSCQDSPTHTPHPNDESLATTGGPSLLPCSTGHWPGLPLALVSTAQPSPVAISSLCLQPWLGPAASMLHRTSLRLPRGPQPLPSSPLLGHKGPQRWYEGWWSVGGAGPVDPALRSGALLLAPPSSAWEGTHLDGTQSPRQG